MSHSNHLFNPFFFFITSWDRDRWEIMKWGKNWLGVWELINNGEKEEKMYTVGRPS